MPAFDLNTPLGQALVSTGQGLGYDSDHIAGALGTAMTESGMNPGNTSGDNGASWGGFQWQGPRLRALQQYAASRGRSWQDPNLQAQFWYQEHNGPEAGAGFNDASGINGITNSVLASQRPQGWDNDPAVGQKYLGNILLARQALAKASGGDPSNVMAYAGDDSGGAPGAIRAATAGRAGTLSQPTPGDTSAISQMLSRYTGQGQALGAPQDPANPVENFGNGLTRLGAAFMVRDNPYSAQTLLSSIKAQTKAKDDWKDVGDTGDGKFRKQFNPTTGQYRDVPNEHPDTPDDTSPSNKDIDRNRAKFQTNENTMSNASEILDHINQYRQAIAEGRLHVTAYDRAHGFTSNVTNSTNDNDASLKSLEAEINTAILTRMRELERGASTGKQLAAAEQSILPQGGKFSDRTVLDALDRIVGVTSGIHHNAAAANASVLKAYPQIGDTGLTDPGTGKDQDSEFFRQKYQDRIDKYSQFEKEQAPRRQQFIETFGKKGTAKPASGGGASFRARLGLDSPTSNADRIIGDIVNPSPAQAATPRIVGPYDRDPTYGN